MPRKWAEGHVQGELWLMDEYKRGLAKTKGECPAKVLPKRGDFVRFVRRHTDLFAYQKEEYKIQTKEASNDEPSSIHNGGNGPSLGAEDCYLREVPARSDYGIGYSSREVRSKCPRYIWLEHR